MIDINPLIVEALNEIGLPVLLENFLDSTTPLPCITYIEYSNRDTLTGTTLEYSEIITMVKVWSNSMKMLIDNASKIDTKMKAIGFKRDYGSPLFRDGIGQYILRYKSTGLQRK